MIRPRIASIRTQLLLGIVLTLTFVGAFVLLVLPPLEHRIMQKTEREKLEGIAVAIAWFVAPGLDFNDPDFVAETIEYFFTLPEVHGIEVYDATGELFCAAGAPYPATIEEQQGLLKVAAPAMQNGSELGSVVLVTRTEALTEALQSSRVIISTIILISVVIGGLAAILLAKHVLRPILELHEATRVIAEGNFGVRVPVHGSTELADLAHAFNLMIERLRATTTSRNELEREVEEKQNALEEIQRLKERAEELSRVKSEFLANMSHEIRTPMNGILGLTELTLDTSLESSQRNYLGGVLEAGRHLLAILNDVLDLSKIEAGKLEITPVPTDIAELVSSLGIQHGTVAHAKGIQLHASLGPNVPRYVIADGLRIRQILANLAGNAIKFTPEGHVRIDIRGEEDRGTSDVRLRFSVRDTGIGIEPSKQRAIFDPFEQADGSTTRNFGGTGLGLTISLRLAKAMGGEIELDSTPGEGSEFFFTLALPRAAGPEESVWASSLRGVSPDVYLEVSEEQTKETLLANLSFWGSNVVTAREDADLEIRDELPATTAAVPAPEDGSEGSSARESAEVPIDLSPVEKRGSLPSISVVGIQRSLGETSPERRVQAPFGPLELGAALWACVGGHPEEDTMGADTSDSTASTSLEILVAEDNLTNQMVITRMLERHGHVVTVVENGREAVDLLGSRTFDLILMDWHMPVMNGLEATEAIRRGGSRVRIIALTANALPGDRDLCLEAGMNGYLSKPIRRDELDRLLLEAIRTKEDSRAGDAHAA